MLIVMSRAICKGTGLNYALLFTAPELSQETASGCHSGEVRVRGGHLNYEKGLRFGLLCGYSFLTKSRGWPYLATNDHESSEKLAGIRFRQGGAFREIKFILQIMFTCGRMLSQGSGCVQAGMKK